MTDRDCLILAIHTTFFGLPFSLPALTEAVVQIPILNRYWRKVYGTTAPHALHGITRAKLVADLRRASSKGVPVRKSNGRRRSTYTGERKPRLSKEQKISEMRALLCQN